MVPFSHSLAADKLNRASQKCYHCWDGHKNLTALAAKPHCCVWRNANISRKARYWDCAVSCWKCRTIRLIGSVNAFNTEFCHCRMYDNRFLTLPILCFLSNSTCRRRIALQQCTWELCSHIIFRSINKDLSWLRQTRSSRSLEDHELFRSGNIFLDWQMTSLHKCWVHLVPPHHNILLAPCFVLNFRW